jgi:excisionase family DNA binding protein
MSGGPFVSVVEASRMLGLTEDMVRKGCHAGTIPFWQARPGGTIRIPRAWIERMVDGRESVKR